MAGRVKIELPEVHLENVNRGLENIVVLDEFLTRGAIAGFDVKALKDHNAAQKKQLLGIKQGFFPNR